MVSIKKHFTHLGLAALVALVTLMPEMASAQFTALENGICILVNAISGKVGQAIGTLAIIFLGIGAFFGKVNWGLAVIVGVGIAAIFGAAQIAGLVAAGAGGTGATC